MTRRTQEKPLKPQSSSITKVMFLAGNFICFHIFTFDETSPARILEKLVSQTEFDIIPVKLPRKLSHFVKGGDGSIYELLQFNEKNRSWFIGDTVCSDGKIYISTPIDPLFIFLQYLEESCKERAEPLTQIMDGSLESFFSSALKISQMRMIADQKGPDDLKAFKYNEDKTLKWLKKKFQQIHKSLKMQNIINSGAASMNFVQSHLDTETVDDDAIQMAALGIISEYISMELIGKLDSDLGISRKLIEPVNQKRKHEQMAKNEISKRVKVEDQENFSDVNQSAAPKTAVKISTKSKALEKAAKGSKSISSFFSKK